MTSELESHLAHSRPIFKNDNVAFCMKTEEDTRDTSMESAIKSFYCSKDGCGSFQDFISNHAGEVKHRPSAKNMLNLLQNVKWNGRAYPLESHVSNHIQTHYDRLE